MCASQPYSARPPPLSLKPTDEAHAIHRPKAAAAVASTDRRRSKTVEERPKAYSQYTSILYTIQYTLALTPPPPRPRPPSLTLPMAYSTVWPLDNGAKQFHSSSPTTTSILPLSVLLLRNFVVGDHSCADR